MWQVLIPPALGLIKTAYAALFEESVYPEIGSIVFCDILPFYAQHTGVYVGNDSIIHLTSTGLIDKTSPSGFMRGEIKIAPCIWVSCSGEESVGLEIAARRAEERLFSYRDYNFLLDNCHQFCSGCLTGNFENSSNLFNMLEIDCERYMGFDNWKPWVWNEQM